MTEGRLGKNMTVLFSYMKEYCLAQASHILLVVEAFSDVKEKMTAPFSMDLS
jgi:hypothetical protein